MERRERSRGKGERKNGDREGVLVAGGTFVTKSVCHFPPSSSHFTYTQPEAETGERTLGQSRAEEEMVWAGPSKAQEKDRVGQGRGPHHTQSPEPCPNPGIGPQRCWLCQLEHSWRKTVKPSVTDKSNSESPLFSLGASGQWSLSHGDTWH